MMVKRISNISLADIRNLLKKHNCKLIRTRGGHETWTRADLLRPIIIQTHVDPVPKHIVKQILRHLSLDISALG
ncbi:MAG: type II toxin-antitoxin system HicA family toxin [Bacteroidetes bacterium]|nr:type II toxin-antitoxin system HicA family toxin [Bacteroidota bacterium]